MIYIKTVSGSLICLLFTNTIWLFTPVPNYEQLVLLKFIYFKGWNIRRFQHRTSTSSDMQFVYFNKWTPDICSNLHTRIDGLCSELEGKNAHIQDLEKQCNDKEWSLGEHRQWLDDANNRFANYCKSCCFQLCAVLKTTASFVRFLCKKCLHQKLYRKQLFDGNKLAVTIRKLMTECRLITYLSTLMQIRVLRYVISCTLWDAHLLERMVWVENLKVLVIPLMPCKRRWTTWNVN